MIWRKPATVVCLSHFSWSGKKKKIKRERERKGKKASFNLGAYIFGVHISDWHASVLRRFKFCVVDVGFLHNKASLETLGIETSKRLSNKAYIIDGTLSKCR